MKAGFTAFWQPELLKKLKTRDGHRHTHLMETRESLQNLIPALRRRCSSIASCRDASFPLLVTSTSDVSDGSLNVAVWHMHDAIELQQFHTYECTDPLAKTWLNKSSSFLACSLPMRLVLQFSTALRMGFSSSRLNLSARLRHVLSTPEKACIAPSSS